MSFSRWMFASTNHQINKEKSLTKSGHIKSASLPTVCQWVLDSWHEVTQTCVSYSFKKCGISNKMDGTEDDLLGQDLESEDRDSDRMSEMDPTEDDIFDDGITHEEFNELFNSDDDEPFNGFEI